MSLIAPWRDARGIKSTEVHDQSGDLWTPEAVVFLE